jgi:branched-chain amino acid transport system permease protein
MELALGISMNSLVLAAMYILVALGFALLFSIAGILNFAHGAIYMVGGYICYQFAVEYGLNVWVAVLLSMIVIGAFGLFLERFCFRPFSGDMFRTIVIAIAIIVILETGINVLVGSVGIRAIPILASGRLMMGPISITWERVVTVVTTGALLAVMIWFINRTKQGLQMQAISQDPEGATLQGVRIHQISALTCGLGCALAAVAGCFMGSMFNLSPFMGDLMLVKATEIVIIGGIGSIGGVLAGGLVLGIIDAALPQFLSGAATQAVGLGVIIIFLLFRPQGFFGRLV